MGTTKTKYEPKWIKVIPLLIFLISWEIIVHFIDYGDFYFASPSGIAITLYNQLMSGKLLIDTGVTLIEVLSGFILGNLIGTIIGIIFWYNKNISLIIKPYLTVLGSIPIIAIAPILIIFFGIGMLSKIIIVFLSTVVISTIQAYEGATQTDKQYILYLQSIGSTRLQIFRKIVLPSSLIWLFTGFKLNIGFAILGAFIGEFISSNQGLGHMIIIAMGLFDTKVIFSGIVVISIMSFSLNRIIEYFQKKYLPWQYVESDLKNSR
ncbi:MAG: binding-protein-dependent transport system inner rane component [Ignavibacteria bacterium]|nr:binding-protein-dependent transport system inner rane component [Ignavibacteria bacterium]